MRHYFILALILNLISMSIFVQYANSQEDETTILWYKFDVDFKNEIEDRGIYENHGKITGQVKFEPEGQVGGAAKFAAGNRITVPISDTLNVEEEITVEFWVKPDNVPAATYWRLLHKGWVENGSYICGIDNNWMTLGYTWDINNMAGVRKDANKENAVIGETWQYFSATYDGEKIILYIDGEPQVQTAANGKINGVFDIIIAESFSGLLDEIRISNIALTQDEIKKHMEGQELHSIDVDGKLAISWAEMKRKQIWQ